jgi:hypothetical protein
MCEPAVWGDCPSTTNQDHELMCATKYILSKFHYIEMSITRIPIKIYLGTIIAIPVFLYLLYSARCAVREKSASGCFGSKTFDAEYNITILYMSYGIVCVGFLIDVLTMPRMNMIAYDDNPTLGTRSVQHTANQPESQQGSQMGIEMSNEMGIDLDIESNTEPNTELDNRLDNELDNELDNRLDNELDNRLDNELNNRLDNRLDNRLVNELDSQLDNGMNNELNNRLDNRMVNGMNNELNNRLDNRMVNGMNNELNNRLDNRMVNWTTD